VDTMGTRPARQQYLCAPTARQILFFGPGNTPATATRFRSTNKTGGTNGN